VPARVAGQRSHRIYTGSPAGRPAGRTDEDASGVGKLKRESWKREMFEMSESMMLEVEIVRLFDAVLRTSIK